MDDSLDTLECGVINVKVLDSFAHSGDHRSKVLDVTHLLDILDLLEEVVEVKFVFLDLLLNALCLFLVVNLLSTFRKLDDISHSEDSVSHTLGVEFLDILELFARTHIFDRFVDNGAD